MRKSSHYIEAGSVYLRPVQLEDLNQTYLDWVNDPEVNRYLESGHFPSTMTDLRTFYERMTASRENVFLAICDMESGQHIGNCRLGPIVWVYRRATLAILIGEKEYWGRGVGSEVTRALVDYAFSRLNLHRVDLGVYAEHAAAVRAYEKVGFKVEGRLREDMFHEGAYKDRLLMGILRSDFDPSGAAK